MGSVHWRKPTTVLVSTATLVLALVIPGTAQESKGPNLAVSDGKQVSLEYTLTLEDQSVVDSNVGKKPLVYTQGSGQIIPGLEKQLAGLKAGDTKKVEVTPEDGYGTVDPQRVQEIPIDRIPENARKAGTMLQGQGPGGQPVMARVAEVKDKTVVVDMNHPLAGKKLFFDVKVLKVEEGGATQGAASATPPPAAQPKK